MTCTKKEKYIGALISSAIGDALGWPNEQNSRNISLKVDNIKTFVSWNRKCGGRYWPYVEKIAEGEYSDDTQLIIGTLRSLLRGNQWSNFFRRVELPAWLSYERGGGGATKRAAKKWKMDSSPWDEKNNSQNEIKSYFNAGGNGVAMRILPHVFCNENNYEKVMSQVVLNGMYTHGHPRALIGAMLYACAINKILEQEGTLAYGELVDYLIDKRVIWSKLPDVNNMNLWKLEAKKYSGYDYDAEWDKCIEETIELLYICQKSLNQGILDISSNTLELLGCFDSRINGAGNRSAVISIYLFSKYADNPYMAICEAANLKSADTDTLASMVGGIVGSLNGISWIPVELRAIQDFEMYKILIEQLLDGKCDYFDDARKYQLFDSNRLSYSKVGDTIQCIPFGEMKLIDIRDEKAMSRGMYVKTFIWTTCYKQTVFSKKIGKIEKDNKENIEFSKEDKSLKKNEFRLSKDNLYEIQIILGKMKETQVFIEIFGEIMDLQNENLNKKQENEAINKMKEKWKEYRLTKKQILAVRKILTSEK